MKINMLTNVLAEARAWSRFWRGLRRGVGTQERHRLKLTRLAKLRFSDYSEWSRIERRAMSC